MALSKKDKDYIVNKVVEILKSEDKEKLVDALRQEVFSRKKKQNNKEHPDDVVYAVIQAIEELYG